MEIAVTTESFQINTFYEFTQQVNDLGISTVSIDVSLNLHN